MAEQSTGGVVGGVQGSFSHEEPLFPTRVAHQSAAPDPGEPDSAQQAISADEAGVPGHTLRCGTGRAKRAAPFAMGEVAGKAFLRPLPREPFDLLRAAHDEVSFTEEDSIGPTIATGTEILVRALTELGDFIEGHTTGELGLGFGLGLALRVGAVATLLGEQPSAERDALAGVFSLTLQLLTGSTDAKRGVAYLMLLEIDRLISLPWSLVDTCH